MRTFECGIVQQRPVVPLVAVRVPCLQYNKDPFRFGLLRRVGPSVWVGPSVCRVVEVRSARFHD